MAWFVDVMNGADLTQDDYDTRFGAEFQAQLSFDDIVALLPELRKGQTGWSVVETEQRDEQSGSFVVAPASGEPRTRLLLQVAAGDGTIDTLFFQPADPPSLDDPPETFEGAVTQLGEYGRSAALVAEVSSGECSPIEQSDAEVTLAIGSVFKLYVLGAVVDSIERDELAWDDELVFTEALASFPSGITQDEEPGTALTVQELATRMISISDNTATDMLIDALGRETVAAFRESMGHTDPALNQPFLTTRDLFIIKLDADLLAQYDAADPAERATILDEIADRPLPDAVASDFAAPISPDRVEWFATPSDLCRALVHLADRAEQPGLEPIRDMMAAEPGVPDDRFDEIWFKGGSETGLLAVAWLVRAGEQTFTVTGSVVNPDTAFDLETALLTFATLRGFAS